MSEAAIIDLILKGGAVAVLVIVGVLILRGDLQTKSAVKATLDASSAGSSATLEATNLMVAEIKAAHAREMAEVVRDRDDWKAIAKDAVADVRELGEALTVRNRIDEELRKSGLLREAGAA